MSTQTDDHPIIRARREQARGGSNELAAMRSQIAQTFGIRLELDRLDDDEARRLLELHRQATEPGEWQEVGARHYGLLSRLDKRERSEWRKLVGKAANVDLDATDKDIAEQRRMRELARRAAAPVPSQDGARIPASALDDLYAGTLMPIDLGLLSTIALTFATGTLHPAVEQRQLATWTDDGECLLVHGEITKLMPTGWGDEVGWGTDAIVYHRNQILERLTGSGWLMIERRSPQELALRLGPRFSERGDA